MSFLGRRFPLGTETAGFFRRPRGTGGGRLNGAQSEAQGLLGFPSREDRCRLTLSGWAVREGKRGREAVFSVPALQGA